MAEPTVKEILTRGKITEGKRELTADERVAWDAIRATGSPQETDFTEEQIIEGEDE